MFDTVSFTSPSRPSGDATSPAVVRRLEAIGKVVSSFDVAKIRSHADMTRVLCALELANKCIHVVLNDVPGGSVRDRLIDDSERLIGMIEVARQEVEGLRLA